MALLYIKPIPGREADIGKFQDWKFRRQWTVMTDTRAYHEGAVLLEGIAAGYFPTPFFSFHPDDLRFLCKRLSARQDTKSPLHWRVTAEWDTAPWDDDDEEEPQDRRAKITWSTVKYQKAIERDRDGKAILNSAKDYFDPPPLKDLSRWTITVTKNLTNIPTSILDYADKINGADWSVDGIDVPKNAAKMMSIGIGDKQREGNIDYRQLSYTVEFDTVDLWKGKYLNQGYNEITDPSTNPPTKKRCQIGRPPKDAVSPQMLDANGKMIAAPTPANATFQEYNVHEEMDFSVLPVT